jgi:regulation of enolase protein 1 (concanavalin A-like superfamily)
MLRLLLPALALATTALAAPVPKETDAGRMTRIYGTVHDPKKDSTFRPVGTALEIAVPNEQRLLGPWCQVFNAPRVWREVRGDFTVTVRVSFPIRPKLPARHAEVAEARAGGGLVVWIDDGNFLTVTRDEREYKSEPGEFFRTEVNNEARAGSYSEYSEPGRTGYLRVYRKGNVFESRYSTDGKKWKLLRQYELEWADEVKVGVVAENSFNAPFEILFDEYALVLTK